MTRVWIVAALSVLLIAGCNSNGSSSSSKDSLYRQIFAPAQQSSPGLENQEPNMINAKEFNPSDYAEVYKSPDFLEFYDPDKPKGYGIEAFAVLVEETPTVKKYVYIFETIDYTDKGLGGTSALPMGELSYTGNIEYYDPENDPNLDNVNKVGKFELIRTYNGTGRNSIELDWNGDGTPDINTKIEIPEDESIRDVDFTFKHDLSEDKVLNGHGTFHQNWRRVYGLFKSPNYAGGFKGECDWTNCNPD